ncbi:MAG: hypothetical protein GHCLOJNM_04063 [bacterium]|nr:hypothetical protein [bacterium]
MVEHALEIAFLVPGVRQPIREAELRPRPVGGASVKLGGHNPAHEVHLETRHPELACSRRHLEQVIVANALAQPKPLRLNATLRRERESPLGLSEEVQDPLGHLVDLNRRGGDFPPLLAQESAHLLKIRMGGHRRAHETDLGTDRFLSSDSGNLPWQGLDAFQNTLHGDRAERLLRKADHAEPAPARASAADLEQKGVVKFGFRGEPSRAGWKGIHVLHPGILDWRGARSMNRGNIRAGKGSACLQEGKARVAPVLKVRDPVESGWE